MLQIFPANGGKGGSEDKRLGAAVEIKGGDIGGWRLVNCRLLVRRKFGLQLIGDDFGNLALDGKYVGPIAIVSLRPKVRVTAMPSNLGPRHQRLYINLLNVAVAIWWAGHELK